MKAERWKRISELFEAAQKQPPGRRTEFLRQACQGVPDLREEIESLLKAAGTRDPLLDGSPLSSLAERPPALKPGDQLGNFQILALLGRGGMGEVYRARDLRLKREVAIKTLPPGFAGNRDRVTRFELEARAASALNHPNIVTIHDIGADSGVSFIVSELVEGETLESIVERGPVPLAKLIDVSKQIAEGLAAAHAAGVVHRDLKPGNIMLTPAGRVKILDFGLARLERVPGIESTTMEISHPGMILGTPGYMSPEQVRGEPADARSDLFSLGVILYQMASGKPAFHGDSSIEVMNSILKDDPPGLPDSVPLALAQIVRRCLEKERSKRFQSAADLGFALQALLGTAPSPSSKRRGWRKSLIAAVACIAIGGGLLFWLNRPLPPPRVIKMVQITHDNLCIASTICPLLSDGSRIFYRSDPIYQVSVKGGESIPLPLQTKGNIYLADISPDHSEFLVCRFLGYPVCEPWAEPVIGGSPHRLGNIVAHNAAIAWSPDGQQLVYARDTELHLATRDGTEIRKVASFAGGPTFLRWSPDGRKISVSVRGEGGSPTRLWEVSPDGSGLRRVLPEWNPSWSTYRGIWTADGRYFIFLADQKIWVVREKGGFLQRGSRDPVELNTGLLDAEYPLPSPDGKRLFFEGFQARNEFMRYDLKSGHVSLELAGISGSELEFSRDGKWITYVSIPERNLFRAAADGSQRVQLTWPPLRANMPHWSPDGKQIAFSGSIAGQPNRIYILSSDGGSPRQVTHGEAGKRGDIDASWSSDGTKLAFSATYFDKPGEDSIHVVDLKTNQVSKLPGSEGMWAPRWSPAGNLLAGQLAPTQKVVLYDFRTKMQTEISGEGSAYPTWSRDGELLYFLNDSGWWRVRVREQRTEFVGNLKNGSRADWGWFAIAPNNSLITARSTGTGEIYALDWDLP